MEKIFLVVIIIVGVFSLFSALFISLLKRKNVGDVDVTFNHIYNKKNLKQVVSNSAEVGKFNSPFIENKSMSAKIEQGTKIISSSGIIYKKENNYDCKPKW